MTQLSVIAHSHRTFCYKAFTRLSVDLCLYLMIYVSVIQKCSHTVTVSAACILLGVRCAPFFNLDRYDFSSVIHQPSFQLTRLLLKCPLKLGSLWMSSAVY